MVISYEIYETRRRRDPLFIICKILCLSYGVAVIQWITSCYNNCMTTRYITLWREQVTSWRRQCQPCIFVEQLSALKAIKSNLKGSYDKQNLTLVVIWNLCKIGSQNTQIIQTRFINFILNDHECKILFITLPLRSQKCTKYIKITAFHN